MGTNRGPLSPPGTELGEAERGTGLCERAAETACGEGRRLEESEEGGVEEEGFQPEDPEELGDGTEPGTRGPGSVPTGVTEDEELEEDINPIGVPRPIHTHSPPPKKKKKKKTSTIHFQWKKKIYIH